MLAMINTLRTYQSDDNTTPVMSRFTDTLHFCITLRYYKWSLTLGVINILDRQNVLTTLVTPSASETLVENRDFCTNQRVPVTILPSGLVWKN